MTHICIKLLHNAAGISHDKQKLYYDQKVFGDPYARGKLVWLLNPKVSKSTSKKLFHPWNGPFKGLKNNCQSIHIEFRKLRGGNKDR